MRHTPCATRRRHTECAAYALCCKMHAAKIHDPFQQQDRQSDEDTDWPSVKVIRGLGGLARHFHVADPDDRIGLRPDVAFGLVEQIDGELLHQLAAAKDPVDP